MRKLTGKLGFITIIGIMLMTVCISPAADVEMTMEEAVKPFTVRFGLRDKAALQAKIVAFLAAGTDAEKAQKVDAFIGQLDSMYADAPSYVVTVAREAGFAPTLLEHMVGRLGDPGKRALALQYLPQFADAAIAPVALAISSADPATQRGGILAAESMATSNIRGWKKTENSDILVIALIPHLTAKHPDSVTETCTSLAAFYTGNGQQKELILPVLQEALTTTDQTVKRKLILFIADKKLAPDFAESLLAVLRDPGADGVFIAASQAITGTSANQLPCIEAVITVAQDASQSRRARLASTSALARVHAVLLPAKEPMIPPQVVVDTIASMLGDADDVLALAAAQTLARSTGDVVTALTPVLAGDDPQGKRFGLYAVSLMGAKAAALGPAVLALATDSDPYVRRNAVEAGAILHGADAKAMLMAALADADLRVSGMAAEQIEQRLAADADCQAALATYRTMLAERNVSAADPDDTEAFPSDRYLVGGTLAGVTLPPYPAQHGEVPGTPGTIPELAAAAAAEHQVKVDAGEAEPWETTNRRFTPVGLAPEVQLYDGSVEHYRNYWMKYCPVRSFFDEQSLVKAWPAGNIPGPEARLAEYAEPISWSPRWGHSEPTGYTRAPVTVQRFSKSDAPFVLDCGVLQPGAYTIRIIAAVKPEDLQWFRKSLVVRLKINDGIGGEVNEYALRCNYTDEFYSMCEISFNTPEHRAYTAELSLDAESEVELLVHTVTLDDAMAGVTRRAIKTQMTMHGIESTGMAVDPSVVPEKNRKRRLLAEERDMRDRWLWRSFPPAAAQKGNGGYRPPKEVITAPGPRPAGSFTGDIGRWTGSTSYTRNRFNATPVDPDVWMVNDTLGLVYTITDLQAGAALPDPYPYKDRGYGIVWQDDQEMGTRGRSFTTIGEVVQDYHLWYPDSFIGACDQWAKTGDVDTAHDAAVALARWAYAFPAMTTTDNVYWNNLADVGASGQQQRFHKRMTTSTFYSWYTKYATTEIEAYDRLYPFIENNWEVARAVGEFVPWVKTPRDVIKLIDTHLVQMTAKKILRYQWYTGEMKIATLASVLGDGSVTDPWMEWLFAAASVYPFPVAGLTDLLVSGTTREGTEYVASTMYARGENALPKAAELDSYLAAGGNPKYDLSDAARYPKPLASCYWIYDSNVAGLNFLRIGDVTGPEKSIGQGWSAMAGAARWGWTWGRDPYFAQAMVHYFPGELVHFSAEEKARITAAATGLRRPLWLDLRSRIMPQWAAVLETGLEHDDYRFRRSVAVRTGMGWGHHHNDGLDLQVYAHGTMMTADGGQRPGYSRPADRSTRMHNLVEVDGAEWLVHSWTNALSDGAHAKYTRNSVIPPADVAHVDLYSRQTALIDVDEGAGSEPLDIARMGLKPKGLNPQATSANSYVFDVFRVSGGKQHTYSFHGTLSSKVMQNIEAATPYDGLPDDEKEYIHRMAGERLGGDAPEHLTVDFHIQDAHVKADLPADIHEHVKPHVTRLHLLGHQGARVLRGSLDCTHVGYQIPMVFIQNSAAQEAEPTLQTAFAAVIEPYVDTPFITGTERLTIADNETDARQAVAIRVSTVNGHTDLCFADGRPDTTRSVAGVSVSGEFAYLSRDGEGLRQASLTGGTRLVADDISITTATREYTATVAAVDYETKTMTLDRAWPAATFSPAIIEVGTEDHWTAYHTTAQNTVAGQTAITVKGGADYYLSRVKEVDPQTNTVVCSLGFGSGTEGKPAPGINQHWIATNEARTKWWRAEFVGGDIGLARYEFKLSPLQPTAGDAGETPIVSMDDFGAGKAFRLWEYGPGDSVRHGTFVSLSRQTDGVYLLESDVDCVVGLTGTTVSLSTDGETWKAAAVKQAGPLAHVTISQQDLVQGRVYIRVE